ncbi:uncharacterized protein C8Q71DRAFT_722637 [Rhodofomes roseus]|uniref:Uncharacterized protein n=1 Tax=Rhodofomes roseus TaxID=34475 RepID=A0ABQ8KK11_9APHY|nr:uncharacterized protein C8Q71DRAFT_722637 [Rhodofomes roseus]KAH9838462.1 hypothetical protein C8Q71DRAFT_722637 [Rhodofomes roseus]
MFSPIPLLVPLAALAPLASAHIALWNKAMYGFNVSAQTFSYDNRPVVPLVNQPFDQWWFHGHLGYPPNAGDVAELPAGGTFTSELSCDKGATSNWPSSDGGNAGYPSTWPCPGQDSSQFHTNSIDDTKGCSIAIADKENASDVQPEDFTIISTNDTCVWNLNTDFQIPAQLPACSGANCVCAWFWIHSDDSGAEQLYMTGFNCNVTGATGTTPIGQKMLARQCGTDTTTGLTANPGNCTIGPKYPIYWLQAERNNFFEGYYDVPYYNQKMGFQPGAQDDIFQDAYISSLGPGSATATAAARREVPVAEATPNPDVRGMMKRHKRMMDLGHGSL